MKNPIHITHIVHSLGAGGMENGVVNIIRHLQGAEFKFSIICLTQSGSFQERLPPDIPVVELNKDSGLSPALPTRMAKALQQLGSRVLHTHNWATLVYAVPGRILAGGLPILHGEHAQLSPAELKPHRLAIRRFLYRFAKRIHTVSRGQKDELVDLGFPAQRIEAVINGVDTMRFRPAQDRATARSAFDIPESATVIGMVGRFGEFKRHDALISAFEQAALQHPNAYLLLPGAGGPKEKATRERVASSEFRSRMMLPGFLQDPRPAYQAMDLLVVPSVNEGLSNAALEAMASGVPVLAHRSCGAAELLGDGLGGWVHDLSSTRQITEELTNLLESPDRIQEQANLARQRIEERYSIQAMITHYHRLYGELVD